MNKFKIVFLVLISLCMVGCGAKEASVIETSNLGNVANLNEIDDQVMGVKSEDGFTVESTFYLKDNAVVSSLVKNKYENHEQAQIAYQGLKYNSDYINVKIDNNTVMYSYDASSFVAYKDMTKEGILKVLTESGYIIK